MQGEGGPEVNAFFCDARKELNHLHPTTRLAENETRGVTVEIRAIIADAPARCWLCGVKYYSGFYGCSRCKAKGAHPIKKTLIKEPVDPNNPEPRDENGPKKYNVTEMTTVKFPTIGHPPRIFDEWESYKQLPPGEKDKKMIHRTGTTPLDRIAGPIDPINQVVLEEMHVMDGGVLKDTIAFLLSIKTDKKSSDAVPQRRGKNAAVYGSKKKTINKITPVKFRPWNGRINIWSQYTPKEFGRKCTSMEYCSTWKMNQYRQMFNYYMPALMKCDEINFGKPKRYIVLNLILGYKLITGNTHKPVPDRDIELSRHLLCKAFRQLSAMSLGNSCTYKLHVMTHMPDDAKNMKAHTGAFSAYPYESQLVHFRHLGLQGNRVIQQIANRLLERGHLHEDLDEGENACNFDEESIESFMAKVMRNRTSDQQTLSQLLDFPPFFVHDFNEKKKVVTCESFTVTNKFPDNVVRLHFETKSRRHRNAFAITDIFRDPTDGQLKIRAREFVKLKNTFDKPYPSSAIGNFEGTYQPPNKPGQKTSEFNFADYPFARIIGKFFCFPKLVYKRKTFDPLDCIQKQTWILQEIGHSEV
jgi:hypothetical protein